MRLISWNIHFHFNQEKYNHIIQKEPDILVIEECHTNDFCEFQKDWKNVLHYNDQLYDNNPKADNKNMHGIAIFSNKYRFEFTENFNRNLRYVVPLKVYSEETNAFLF